MTKGKKITIWILAIVLAVIVGTVGKVYFYGNHLFNKLEKVEIDKEDIGITEEVQEKLSQYSNSIINIALFGVDAVDGDVGRSDSIMIATIDTVHKKLKLTSIMRDSYVAIDGHGNDKLNHAYAFGGPQLAIKTLNENFDLNIENFASVNFETLPKIIDELGGIELNIDADELEYINGYIAHLNNINGTSEPAIESTGIQHVSGTQALAFCRIRYTSGGDYKRTERHREVLTEIFKKIETMPVTSYPSLLSEILPMVNTSLGYSDILELGTEVLKLGDSNLQLERFPLDDYCEGKMISGIYYLTFDKEVTVEQLHNYIFEDKITW